MDLLFRFASFLIKLYFCLVTTTIYICVRSSQSHYIEVAHGDIYMEQKNQIWASFGTVGNTEKAIGPIMSNFWGFFQSLRGNFFLIF